MKHFFTTLLFMAFSLMSYGQLVTQGLVSHYSFNDGTTNDMAGDNHGQNLGATTGMDRFGNAGYAMYFDGDTARIEIGDSSEVNLNNMSNLTISCWTKADTFTSGLKGIVTKWTNNSSTEQYGLFASNDDHLFAVGTVNANGYTFAGNIDSTWHHVVIVYDMNNTSVEYYVDGARIATAAFAAFPGSTGTSSLHIGSQYNGRHFKGYIDDVMIYDRALDSMAVDSLYKMANPNPSSSVVETSQLENIKLFPNPTSGVLTFMNTSAIDKVEVFNLQGQLVRQQAIRSNQIDLTELENSWYIIQLYTEGELKAVSRVYKQ